MSEDRSKEEAVQGAMPTPETFYYANSIRVYSGAGDYMMDFGRALPVTKAGAVPDAVGIVGVILPAVVAMQLAKQIVAQARLLTPQMREMADAIDADIGGLDVLPKP